MSTLLSVRGPADVKSSPAGALHSQHSSAADASNQARQRSRPLTQSKLFTQIVAEFKGLRPKLLEVQSFELSCYDFKLFLVMSWT